MPNDPMQMPRLNRDVAQAIAKLSTTRNDRIKQQITLALAKIHRPALEQSLRLFE
jgi:hypothetical protein